MSTLLFALLVMAAPAEALDAAPMSTAVPMPSEAVSESFKVAFAEGEKLYGLGEYGAAIFHFRRADRLRVTPEVAFDLAKCFEKLNDEAFTVYYYRLYLRRSPKAPDASEVTEQLETLLGRARLKAMAFVEVDAPAALSLTLNGRRFPESPLALFVVPGDYEVSGMFPDGLHTLPLKVAPGGITSAYFEPVKPPLLTSKVALVDVKPAPSASSVGLRIAGGVTAGLGVAALVVGLVLGLSAQSDFQRVTDRTLMVSDAFFKNEEGNAKAIAANVLFGAGAVAVATGGVLFGLSFLPPGDTRR